VGGVTTSLKRLDPNMLAVLMLVMVLNGLFFWAYSENLKLKHQEFLVAIQSCNVSGSNLLSRVLGSSIPGGLDR
jgi:hypothetical protein